MKVNIKEDKETCQIHVHIEVDPVVHDGTELGLQEAVYIGVPEVRAILADKGVKVGRLLKRSTINSSYENACSGLWRFEMPEAPKKTPRAPKKATTPRRPRKTTTSAKKSDEKTESEV
tara:strand:- start:479 stop:832 length:354 start_codon:yes stop_codon:yes gene_type:complete